MSEQRKPDLLSRAMAAYFGAGNSIQPTNDSGVQDVEGKTYVVLRNVSGVLAVYRVRNDGMLKGLKRWPSALNPINPKNLFSLRYIERSIKRRPDGEAKQKLLGDVAALREATAELRKTRATIKNLGATTGEIRQEAANALLALVKGEIGAAEADAIRKKLNAATRAVRAVTKGK